MKTIIFTSFGLGAFVSNVATTHPNLFYLALSILAGFLLALLVALLTVGPSPRKQAPTVEQPARKTMQRKATKRQPKKVNFQIQHGIDIYNYPQGATA